MTVPEIVFTAVPSFFLGALAAVSKLIPQLIEVDKYLRQRKKEKAEDKIKYDAHRIENEIASRYTDAIETLEKRNEGLIEKNKGLTAKNEDLIAQNAELVSAKDKAESAASLYRIRLSSRDQGSTGFYT